MAALAGGAGELPASHRKPAIRPGKVDAHPAAFSDYPPEERAAVVHLFAVGEGTCCQRQPMANGG